MATKVASVSIFTSLTDCDEALRRLAECQRRVDILNAKANDKIAPIQEALAKNTAEDLAVIASLNANLAGYTKEHCDEWTGRSAVLNFGTLFLRRVTKLAPLSKWTWVKVLERLVERKRKEFIRVKEETDREAIERAKLDDEQLKDLGLCWDTDDSFSYKLAEIEAQPT